MSRVTMSFLIFGLLVASVAAAFLFSGESQLVASSTARADVSAVTDDSSVDAKPASASPCPYMTAASVTTGTTTPCPSMAAADCKKKCSAAADCKKKCSAKCAATCSSKEKKTAGIDDLPYREGTKLILIGRYVCGYCNLKSTDECQAAFQTREGKNYLLVKNNLSTNLSEKVRNDEVEIVTRVRKLGGVKYLEVDVVRPLT